MLDIGLRDYTEGAGAQARSSTIADVLTSCLVGVIPLPGKLQDVRESAGLLPAAALLAHAPVARHQVGQAKHDAQPNHDKQRDEPLHNTQMYVSRHCSLLLASSRTVLSTVPSESRLGHKPLKQLLKALTS